MAEALQVSIDAMLGYEKAYKNLELNIEKLNQLLILEDYEKVLELAEGMILRYPNDFRLNRLLADTCYSQYFSGGLQEKDREKRERAVYFYERCLELYHAENISNVTEENLYMQIATLYMWDEEKIEMAIEIIEKYNNTGKYDNLLAGCFLKSGRHEEARKLITYHSVTNQIFCFNDFTILADIFEKEHDYQSAVCFLEAELETYKVFMKEEGSYADRAYAGQAYIIAGLYEKMGNHLKKKEWLSKARYHALRFAENPSLEIAGMKYCAGVKGRMIDNFGDILKKLIAIPPAE